MNKSGTRDDSITLERLRAYRTTLDDAIADDATSRVPAGGATRVSRRVPVAAAAAVLVVVAVGALVVSNRSTGEDSLSGAVGSDGSDTEPVVDVDVESGEDDEPDRATGVDPAVPALDEALSIGASGPQVRMLEERLVVLGFLPGDVDGVFDERTESAVWAFEKVVVGVRAEEVTGVVDAAVWAALHGEVEIAPRADIERGEHIEVWLPEQVVVGFSDGDSVLVSHMSSGFGGEWCDTVTIDPGRYGNEDGDHPMMTRRCGSAVTPGGVFSVHRRGSGIEQTSLGAVIDPVYFNYGVAIAGSDAEVPSTPSSRGHVEVPAHAMGSIGSLVVAGTPVWVFDGINDPRKLGEQLPRFDWADEPSAEEPRVEEPGNVSGIYAIGDSVLLGAAANLDSMGITVDALESRQMIDAIPAARNIASLDPHAVVVHLGTNAPLTQDTLDEFLDELASVPNVLLVTVRADRSWVPVNNALLRDAAGRPNVIVVDWERLADSCPGDCFAADGIHLRSDGVDHYTGLITDILGLP